MNITTSSSFSKPAPIESIRSSTKLFCKHGKPTNGCCTNFESEVIDLGDLKKNNHLDITDNLEINSTCNRHCHSSKEIKSDGVARRKLIIASILCVIFMVGEIVGGYLSNSLAIATDAAHLLTDFASFMISLFALWIAKRPSTKVLSFGWYRAEVIGALISVLLIWVITAILVYLAVERIIHKTFEIDAKIMLITSGVGVLVNLIMGFTLHQHGHTHGGGSHSHGSHKKQNKSHTKNGDVHFEEHKIEESHKKSEFPKENINVRAAFIHVVGDFLQSFGVFVAAIIIFFKPDWNMVDPICTFLFSVLVLITTFAIIKDTLLVLMEGIPKEISLPEVLTTLLTINGVEKVHNLRIWALSLDKIAMSAHLAVGANVDHHDTLLAARKLIHDRFHFFEITIQIEEYDISMEDCKRCENPV